MPTRSGRQIKSEPVDKDPTMNNDRAQRASTAGKFPVPTTNSIDDEDDVVMVNNDSQADHKEPQSQIDEGYATGPAENYPTPGSNSESQPSTSSNMPIRSSSSDMNIQRLGKDVKELVQAINRLEQIGMENLVFPLPKVAVVGDQSAGKSSLIEAISGIKVPRSSGTCTRCPLHINLENDDSLNSQWSCSVTLHKMYEYYVQQVDNPWIPTDRPSDFAFEQVKDSLKLETVLRNAQTATLNPQDDPRKYMNGNGTHSNTYKVQFSPNVVRLDIRGPGLPNLSFYDLPGIINQTENSSEAYHVKIVKSLVKEYIKDENCLVLLACSMEGDIANSSAAKVVRNMGAEHRCIGVLTKPDRLPAGDSVEIWRAILEGSKFGVAHKYYVTKQPGQQDLEKGITHAEAREQESRFFASAEPWKSEFSRHQERFGTTALQGQLSFLLANQIRDYLPNFEREVNAKLSEVRAQLQRCPEPPTDDALRIVHLFLDSFKAHVSNAIKGEYPHAEFKDKWRNIVEDFRSSLYDMRPVCVLTSDAEMEMKKAFREAMRAKEPINIDDSGDEGTPSPTATRKRAAPSMQITPSKRQKASSGTPSSNRSSMLKKESSDSFYINTHSPKYADLAVRYTLDGIRRKIRICASSSIPDSLHPKTAELIIGECMAGWESPCSDFYRKFESFVRDELHSALTDLLNPYGATDLGRQTTSTVDACITAYLNSLQQDLKRDLKFEQKNPLTYNDKVLGASVREELSACLNKRKEARTEYYINDEEMTQGKLTQGLDRTKKMEKIKDEALGTDLYHREIEVIAKVKGYYTLASARFVDRVCQLIEGDTFQRIQDEVHVSLADAFRVYKRDALENCKRLLAPDPQRELERQELKRKEASLQQALELLAKLR